jgi:hypothetical protein
MKLGAFSFKREIHPVPGKLPEAKARYLFLLLIRAIPGFFFP